MQLEWIRLDCGNTHHGLDHCLSLSTCCNHYVSPACWATDMCMSGRAGCPECHLTCYTNCNLNVHQPYASIYASKLSRLASKASTNQICMPKGAALYFALRDRPAGCVLRIHMLLVNLRADVVSFNSDSCNMPYLLSNHMQRERPPSSLVHCHLPVPNLACAGCNLQVASAAFGLSALAMK